MSSDGIEKVVENRDANSTAALCHRRHQRPPVDRIEQCGRMEEWNNGKIYSFHHLDASTCVQRGRYDIGSAVLKYRTTYA